MLNAIFLLLIAASILVVLFFAYLTKNKLASYVAYIILASYAISMALSGAIGMIDGVDFLAFLVSFLRLLNDIVVFVEIGLILYILFMTKLKSKIMMLKVAIIVYSVLTLVVELNIFR